MKKLQKAQEQQQQRQALAGQNPTNPGAANVAQIRPGANGLEVGGVAPPAPAQSQPVAA
jgi:hypothetical protein